MQGSNPISVLLLPMCQRFSRTLRLPMLPEMLRTENARKVRLLDWREIFWILAPLPTNISTQWLYVFFLRYRTSEN